jgi:hypothetical protein
MSIYEFAFVFWSVVAGVGTSFAVLGGIADGAWRASRLRAEQKRTLAPSSMRKPRPSLGEARPEAPRSFETIGVDMFVDT